VFNRHFQQQLRIGGVIAVLYGEHIFHQSLTNFITFELISYQRLEIIWFSNLLSEPDEENIDDNQKS